MNTTGKIALLLMFLATVVSAFFMARWRSEASDARTGLEASEKHAKGLADDIARLKADATQPNKVPDSTTRYVEVFPRNVPALTKLIESTGDHLAVVADYCGYASYSAPERYAEYKSALIGVAARGKDVDLRVYKERAAEEMMARQFGLDKPNAEEAYKAMSAGPIFKAYFAYYENIGKRRSIPEGSRAFVQLMLKDETDCVEELRSKGVKVLRELTSQPPLFIWIKDNNQAMFSVYNLSSDPKEIAMITENSTLVRLLGDISANLGQ